MKYLWYSDWVFSAPSYTLLLLFTIIQKNKLCVQSTSGDICKNIMWTRDVWLFCSDSILSLFFSTMDSLEASCRDILMKNLSYTNGPLFLLYDTASPLALRLSQAFFAVIPPHAVRREFLSLPNLLSSSQWENDVSEEILALTSELRSLRRGSTVILIQSTNFRLSDFRIRLELFHRGVAVAEFNHLAYIPLSEISTFEASLEYHTPTYFRQEQACAVLAANAAHTEIVAPWWSLLTFWRLDRIYGNTGDYSNSENTWGTFPIGEIFTEAIDLESVNGVAIVEAFPNEDFSVNHTTPFAIHIRNGRVERGDHFPPLFLALYDRIFASEWEVFVRELGFGLNRAISRDTPLSDINFYERKVWVHLSLGKKHQIFGKKLPKTEKQRFHIDVFLALKSVTIGNTRIYEDGKWVW